MKKIHMMFQTMVSVVGERAMDDAWAFDFPPTGRFVPVKVRDRCYWYFDQPDGKGKQSRRYVGPCEDPEIVKRVEDFSRVKTDYRIRRRLVASLTRDGGLVAAEKISGSIVEAMAVSGLFRLGAVIVGTAAFQTYSTVLGIRLPFRSTMTGDADIAQDFVISNDVRDSLPPFLELLHSVDPSFREIAQPAGSVVTASINDDGFKVEFLTTNRGSNDDLGSPSPTPAIGGDSAMRLGLMDFLVQAPIRTVLMHGAGVSVLVPDPARYGVHKLIAASRRLPLGDGALKNSKDVRQAEILFEALAENRQSADIAFAYVDAWRRGPAWQEGIRKGAALMSDTGRTALTAALKNGGRQIGETPILPF